MNAPLKAETELRLLPGLEPAYRVFFRNLIDIALRRPLPAVQITSEPAPFWSDVFVESSFPRRGLVESLLWHLLGIIALVGFSLGAAEPRLQPRTLNDRYISYTPPSFPTRESERPRTHEHAKAQRNSATHQSVIPVPREHSGRSLVTPPDLKLAELGPPEIGARNPAFPAMPLSATGRSRLTVPLGPISVVAAAPDVHGGSGRRSGLPQAAVVGPAPGIGAVSGRSAASGFNVDVVAPPPSVQASSRTAGDVNIGHMEVVAPAPRLPMHEQGVVSGPAQAGLGGAAISVVPPQPSLKSSATLADGRGNGLSVAGLRVVAPPPSIENASNIAGSARAGSLSNVSSQVVPPPPSVQGASTSVDGSRGNSLSAMNSQVVPPPPSMEGAGDSAGAGRGNSGMNSQVVPPPPSVEGGGNLGGGGRGNSLSGGSAVPPSPSMQGVGNGDGGARIMAMNIPPAAAPPAAPNDDDSGPTTQDMPVRLIGLAMALPTSSFFSNYEVFIAEKRLSKNESHLIKLVYEFLPYQRRLSEYGLNNSKVVKLRVKRDLSCDETLQQMTESQGDESHPDPQLSADPALSSIDRSRILPCYRTSADDYRKAVARSR